MSSDLERLDRLVEWERERFQKAANALLTDGFLVRSAPQHEKLYKFAVQNYELIESYFELAGWRVKKDESLGVIGAEGPPSARTNLNLEETLALLILRLLYEEKSSEVTLHGERTILQQDFVEKYRVMTERPLKKTPLSILLRRFQALRLIRMFGEESDPETRILLYPSIVFALDGMAIDEMHTRIETFRKGKSEEEDEE